MMQSVQQVEAGVKTLAQALPSLAPMLAEFVGKLRVAIPTAVSATANPGGAQGPGPSNPASPDTSAQNGLPAPPQPPQGQ